MITHEQLKEHIMLGDKTKAKETVKFSKFFPGDNSFVDLDGAFRDANDWWVDITLQTGLRDSAQLWVSDYKPQDSIKQLRALLEATQKAIDFAEKCMAAPAVKKTEVKKAKK